MFLWLTLASFQFTVASAADVPADEYQVKAAFLLNFVKFIEWPAGHRTNEPISICILGEDPFGATLDQLVSGEILKERRIVVRRLRQWQEPCEVVFVSQWETGFLRILSQVKGGVLTVGESPAFLRHGGMINFVLEDRKVRFDVNLRAVEGASLRVSSRLLSVARSVVR